MEYIPICLFHLWLRIAKWTVAFQTKHIHQLAYNDKGIKDNQSQPIAVYKNDDTLISVYGSVSEAARCIYGGYTKTAIARMLDKCKKGRKGLYFKSITREQYYLYTGKKNLIFSLNNI